MTDSAGLGSKANRTEFNWEEAVEVRMLMVHEFDLILFAPNSILALAHVCINLPIRLTHAYHPSNPHISPIQNAESRSPEYHEILLDIHTIMSTILYKA